VRVLCSATPNRRIDPGARFEVTIMAVTVVHSAPEANGERVVVGDANDHGRLGWSLTEAQVRDALKSRGVSAQEIDDLAARARRPRDQS
jgi:hypothetical protein